jgi:hypothetical protein
MAPQAAGTRDPTHRPVSQPGARLHPPRVAAAVIGASRLLSGRRCLCGSG